MSYSSVRRKRMYDFNKQFRILWEQGLKEAERKAVDIEKQGWKIDVARGALTRSQGRKILAHVIDPTGEKLEQADFIPVAKINDEEFGFITYKLKPTEKKTSAQRTEQEKGIIPSGPLADPVRASIVNRFINTLSPERIDIDTDYGVLSCFPFAYITSDARLSADSIKYDDLKEIAREAREIQKEKTEMKEIQYHLSDQIIDESIKLLEGMKARGEVFFFTFGDSHLDPSITIDEAIKLLHMLRGQTEITAKMLMAPHYLSHKIAVSLENGDMILLSGDRRDPNKTVSVSYLFYA